MAYIREDEADIRLQVQDVNGNWQTVDDGNSWYDYEGADLKAAGSKTRAGGMGKERELGGPATRSDCTLTIQHSPTMFGWHSFLESRCGRGNIRVILTYLDAEGNVIPGAQFQATGIILGAALPGQKTNSPAVGMYKVILGLDEDAA